MIGILFLCIVKTWVQTSGPIRASKDTRVDDLSGPLVIANIIFPVYNYAYNSIVNIFISEM